MSDNSQNANDKKKKEPKPEPEPKPPPERKPPAETGRTADFEEADKNTDF
jgi:hypothetical protein